MAVNEQAELAQVAAPKAPCTRAELVEMLTGAHKILATLSMRVGGAYRIQLVARMGEALERERQGTRVIDAKEVVTR